MTEKMIKPGAQRRSAGDRAQLAATLRWLRELRPVQRPPVKRRPGSSSTS